MNGAYYDDDGFLFKRESFRRAPHNSYALLENAYEVAKRNNIETEKEHDWLGFYEEDELSEVDGSPATDITIDYFSNLSVSMDMMKRRIRMHVLPMDSHLPI